MNPLTPEFVTRVWSEPVHVCPTCSRWAYRHSVNEDGEVAVRLDRKSDGSLSWWLCDVIGDAWGLVSTEDDLLAAMQQLGIERRDDGK